MARLKYLDRDGVELIVHKMAAQLFADADSPLPDFQLLGDEGVAALESALGLPHQHYYRTLLDKAGVLLRSLIKTHPLVDGNKRVGMTATIVFLIINRKMLMASNEELVEFALKIAAPGPAVSWQEVAAWLRGRTVPTRPKPEEIDAIIGKLPPIWQSRNAVVARLEDYADALDKVTEP